MIRRLVKFSLNETHHLMDLYTILNLLPWAIDKIKNVKEHDCLRIWENIFALPPVDAYSKI